MRLALPGVTAAAMVTGWPTAVAAMSDPDDTVMTDAAFDANEPMHVNVAATVLAL